MLVEVEQVVLGQSAGVSVSPGPYTIVVGAGGAAPTGPSGGDVVHMQFQEVTLVLLDTH